MEQNVAGLTVFERTWAWCEANKKQVAWGAGIVVVAGVIVAYYNWSQSEKEVSAGEAMSDVVVASLPGGAGAESADAYLKVAAAYPGTSAGARALLAAAGLLFTQGKYTEAQAQFQRFTHDYPESPFRSEAMLGVAASLDALAKPEEAARAYKELIDRHPGEIVVPQAKFALARIYESQNKLKEARELYEEVYRDVNRPQAYSSIGNEAGIRADELRSKLPAPAPTKALTPAPSLMTTLPGTKTNKP
jgi:tetratricopeptide (TPR) repeat protein